MPECKCNSALEEAYTLIYMLQPKKGLAGQAFTPYQCMRCKEDKMHHNTLTPYICAECGTELIKGDKDE